jgi:hypothetical protein
MVRQTRVIFYHVVTQCLACKFMATHVPDRCMLQRVFVRYVQLLVVCMREIV